MGETVKPEPRSPWREVVEVVAIIAMVVVRWLEVSTGTEPSIVLYSALAGVAIGVPISKFVKAP